MFKKKPKAESRLYVGELCIRVIRTQRRSVTLQVKPEGIVMRSPLICSDTELKDFAERKYAWLLDRSQNMQQQLLAAHKSLQDGERFMLFDQAFTLKVHRSSSSSVKFANNELNIAISSRVKNENAYLKGKLYQFYKDQALRYFESRTPELAKEMCSPPYASIKVRDYKARWGSCSSTGELSFNWRIIMAPCAAIDSVIVHELAHLKHFNHSKAFWQLVYKTDTDYANHHDWFNQNRLALMI